MSRTIRAVGVCLALAVVAACGNPITYPAAPPALSGQPAGTVVVPAGTDFAAAVERLQTAITSGGGTVAAVVDNAADARSAGVEIPANTVVIGGSPAANAPLVRVDQRAALNLPERYLVRQDESGAVEITYNGADFVAALSGVTTPEARAPLRDSIAAVAGQAGPVATAPVAAPLVGVAPGGAVITVFGSADVRVTVDRLRRNAGKAPNRAVAVIDMAGNSGGSEPPLRPTSLVLVSTPEVEGPLLAAAPSFGLELPMRFVVWDDEQNRTQIGYQDVARLAARHGIPAGDPGIARLTTDADRLARLAAGIIE